MERRFGSFSFRRFLVFASILLLWIAVLAVLLYLFRGTEGEETPAQDIHGSLEGRFESSITMELDGETLHYRENEITNYLVIGLDQESVTAQDHQHGGQADFLVVLSIDRIRRTITPVMLDRDTMVEMQTYGVFGHPSGVKTMQLCLAQAYSGLNVSGSQNTVQTVERLLHGIDIHHYVLLDVAAIPLINDALGGVEVTLYDDFTEYDPEMKRGTTIRLMGDQAEFFVRGRMTVADGTNASRMARQQQYLSGLLTQFRMSVRGDQTKLNDVLDSVRGHMTSDAANDTLLRDVNAYDDYEWNAMRILSGESTIDAEGFAEFWVDTEALKQLVAEIWFKR